MKTRRTTAFRLRRTICWPVMASLPFATLAQVPTGGSVSAGTAVIAPSGAGVTVTQTTNRAVVRWQDFGIGAGRSVVFRQPDAGAATLNIVTGATASTLAGSLTANGSVFLVNPNGVFVTPTGTVTVGGAFVASTLGLGETDFMQGRLAFEGAGGNVLNQGLIATGAAGAVALIGSRVGNEGIIRAPLGKVVLGSASKATLDLSGDGFLQVLAPAAATGSDPLVTNSGTIEADGGIVLLKAATVREAVRDAVYMPGEIRARSVSGSDGAIVFDGGEGGNVRVGGRADVAAEAGVGSGGRIDVAGAQVALQGATLTATGTLQGGTVRIGGVPALPAAVSASVDAASAIDVSATGAAGLGGTVRVHGQDGTRMDGAVRATGAAAGGTVEIAAQRTVASAALDRVQAGPGGRVVVEAKNIVVGGGAEAETSYLSSQAVRDQLGGGANVTLRAHNDVTWSNGLNHVTPAGARAGDLQVTAGRSVRLEGAFNTGMGDWTLVANERASAGIDPTQRDMGEGGVDLLGAQFLNSNGKLLARVNDGLGNGGGLADGSQGLADRISLGRFTGDALTAEIAAGAQGAWSQPYILLYDDIAVANALVLTGNLVNGGSERTLAGRSVSWTNEKTGGTVRGEGGTIRFVENGVTTRIGRLGGNDASRLELGGTATAVRTYGDAEPTQAGLGDNALKVAAHNATPVADALSQVFTDGSLAVAGPGVTANAGNHTMQVSATGAIAFKPAEYDADWNPVGGATGAYFVDLTAATMNLQVDRRALTASVKNPGYTYGTPAAAAGLAGVVNGDDVKLTAAIGGDGVTLAGMTGGFGFAPNLRAGTHAFTLTGMTGAGTGNYTLDVSGVGPGTVTIAPKPITYTGYAANQAYGLATLESPTLDGVLAGDAVSAGAQAVNVVTSGQAGGSGTRPVGVYDVGLSSLAGADSANYVLAASGHTPQRVTITPKPVQWHIAGDIQSTYGTPATGMSATLDGLLAGDAVVPSGFLADGLAIVPRTAAGLHTLTVAGLTGQGAGNYTFAAGGHTTRQLWVAPKPVTYGGSAATQVYGQADVAAAQLQGVLAGDAVSGNSEIVASGTYANAGESGALGLGTYQTAVTSLGGADRGNYVIDVANSATRTTTITPRTITFRAAGGSTASTYGSAAGVPTLTLDGLVAGDLVGGTAAAFQGGTAFVIGERTPAGSYTWGVGALTGQAAGNYTVAATGNTTTALVVAPKPITWSVANGSAVYGDALASATTFTSVLAGDEVLPLLSARQGDGSFVARPVVGTAYTAHVTGLDGAAGGNYALQGTGNIAGALAITPRPVFYTSQSATSVYGTLAMPGATTLSNVLAGDSVQPIFGYQRGGADVALTATAPVGSYVQRVAALDNPNYEVVAGIASNLTIQPKPLTFFTPDLQSVYGTPAALGTSALSGVVAGDEVLGLTSFRGSPGYDARLDAGTYAGQLSVNRLVGNHAENYVVQDAGSRAGTLQVDPKPLTYALNLHQVSHATMNTTWTYGVNFGAAFLDGGSGTGAQATLQGVLAADRFDVTMPGQTLAKPTIPLSGAGLYQVGSYTWSQGPLAGSRSGNYVVAAAGNSDVTLRIDPVPLPVQLFLGHATAYRPGSVQYGTTGQYAPSAAINIHAGDAVSTSAVLVTPGGQLSTLPERLAAGTYALAMNGPLQGADAANYTAQPVAASIAVTPKPLAYTVANTSSTYGQQGAAGAVTLDGVLPGDDFRPTGVAVSRNGAAVTLAPQSDAGSYQVAPAGFAGADFANYSVLAGNSRNGTHAIGTAALTLGYDPATFSITYGTPLALPRLDGILFGDDVRYDATATRAMPPGWQTPPPVNLQAATLLDANNYNFAASLAGGRSGNYHLSNPTATISVARKPLVITMADRVTTYGDFIGANVPTIEGVVAGDDLTLTTGVRHYYPQGWSTIVPYTERSGAGTYEEVAYLSGPRMANYIASEQVRTLTVRPRALTFTPAASLAATYGTAVNAGELTGMIFDDRIRAVATLSGSTLETGALVAHGRGDYTYTGRANAGTHAYTIRTGALTGDASGNYVLPETVVNGTFTVARKPITWSVDDASFTYGGLKNCDPGQNCYAWEKGTVAYGAAHVHGLINGDVVTGTQSLIDQLGRAGQISADLPAGPYFQVLTDLAGKDIGNYVLAATGSKPGVLTVRPQWLSYEVSSGAYLPGIGMIGDPGKVTALAVADGKMPAGIQAATVARDDKGVALVNLNDLQLGRYTIRVEALAGEGAGNYRIMQPEDGFRPYSTCAGACQHHRTYWVSKAGVLEVFPDATLGLGLSSLQAPPKPAPFKPVVTVPTGVDFTASLGPEFGRYDNVTGAAGSAGVGATGVSAAGAAQAVTEGSIDLGGNTQLSGQAGTAAQALASLGVTGLKVEAEASVHADAELRSGAGFLSAGVQANAGTELQAGRTGAQLSAEANAGASTRGGAEGDIGIGDGSATGTVSVFAYARADNEWTFKDGKLVSKFDEAIGVGASAATNVGFSSGPGSVDAGVIVYSPGSLGGKFDFSSGYSSGTLSLGLDLGAQIGIFGAGVSLNVSIDLTSISQSMGDNKTVQAIANFLGFTIPGAPRPDPPHLSFERGMIWKDNPEKRVSYLQENPAWKDYYPKLDDTNGYRQKHDMAFFMDKYDALNKQAQALLQRELTYQSTFFNLLKTDQQAAAQYIASDSVKAMKAEEVRLKNEFASIGMKMAMKNGKIVAVNL